MNSSLPSATALDTQSEAAHGIVSAEAVARSLRTWQSKQYQLAEDYMLAVKVRATLKREEELRSN